MMFEGLACSQFDCMACQYWALLGIPKIARSQTACQNITYSSASLHSSSGLNQTYMFSFMKNNIFFSLDDNRPFALL